MRKIDTRNPEDYDYSIIFTNEDLKNHKSSDGSYKNCIFLIDIDFQEDLRFENCIFKNRLSIDHDSVVHFNRCILLEGLSTNITKTTKEKPINLVKLSGCLVMDIIFFNNSTLKGVLDIYKSHLLGGISVNFFYGDDVNSNLKIKDSNVFYGTMLSSMKLSDVLLSNSYFNKMSVYNSNIETLNISNTNFEEMNLDDNNNIKDIKYNKSEIKNVTDTFTYTILKAKAIANNDILQALEFHVNEMDTHLKSINDTKKWYYPPENIGNFIILFLEKHISRYGTSALRVLIFMLGLHVISAATIYCGEFGDAFYSSVTHISPFGDLTKSNVINEYKWWGVVKNIVYGYLIYELIKSLRKYSRRF